MPDHLALAFADLTCIDPFAEQACFVLEQMFGLSATAGRPSAKPELVASHDVTGIVPIHGVISGKVGISIPGRMACAFASHLWQRTILSLGNEVADVAGELANTIAGRAAGLLAGAGVETGLPEIVLGRRRYLDFGDIAAPLTVPIETELGMLALEIGIELNRKWIAPRQINNAPNEAPLEHLTCAAS